MSTYNKYANAKRHSLIKRNGTNIYDTAFTYSINPRGIKESDAFTRNIDKYSDFISWGRWCPDLFYDLITPETGGIRLDLDQRIFLRSTARFISTYGVFPRGYG